MTTDETVTYDVWRWHTEGKFPRDQMLEQGYVHIGIYLAWIIRHGLLDRDWAARAGTKRAVAAVTDGTDSVTALRDMTEGQLCSDMLTDEGKGFTDAYYVPEYGYAADWRGAFGHKADVYAVPDEWPSYERVAPLIDRRYADWVSLGKPAVMPAPSLIPGFLAFWRWGRR
jgi:hypothetical protein